MKPSERVFVRRIAKITRGVERLFHTQLIVDRVVPLLIGLGHQSTETNREDILLVIELVGVEAKKLEKKISLG
jgi:hypothetical protein